MVRTYLGRALAEFVTRHGVFLDVLGMGVLITGDSGVGKSELALELITRGSGLVADDVVELYHIAPETLEGRSPELLKDFLEVRGLGMLNIRTIFGETAVRIRKNLKLIVQTGKAHVRSRSRPGSSAAQRQFAEDVMGMQVRHVDPAGCGRAQSRGAGGSGGAQLRPATARHRQHPGIHRAAGKIHEQARLTATPATHARASISRPSSMQLVVISGLSGSGKSIALNVLEDSGYYCVDNLPAKLLTGLAQFLCAEGYTGVAVSIDVRSGATLNELPQYLQNIHERGFDVRLLFLDAKTETLVKRFSETRRRHPLSDEGRTVPESIARERELLADIAALGHHVDTSDLQPNALRSWVKDFLQPGPRRD